MTVLGAPANQTIFLTEDKGATPVQVKKPKLSLKDYVKKEVQRVQTARIRKERTVRRDAAATAQRNIPYMKEKAARIQRGIEFNNFIARQPWNKSRIDWGLLPAAGGMVVGAVTGGPAGAAAGLKAGVRYSGAGKLTLSGAVRTAAAAGGPALAREVGGSVAHELLETQELGELVDQGKRVYAKGATVVEQGRKVVKQGREITREIKAQADELSDLLTNTGSLAMAGDPDALATLEVLTTANDERRAGISRVRHNRPPLDTTGIYSRFLPQDGRVINDMIRQVAKLDWAVMNNGRVLRLMTSKSPPGARWIVRGDRVQRA